MEISKSVDCGTRRIRLKRIAVEVWGGVTSLLLLEIDRIWLWELLLLLVGGGGVTVAMRWYVGAGGVLCKESSSNR